jgi:murein DD-endopeptidase MepM/ murein hydrolase activator NlpD
MSSSLRSTDRQRIAQSAIPVLAGLCWLLAAPLPAQADPSTGRGLPVDPPLVVVRGFDPPTTNWLAGHRGVDVASTAGATVRATSPGVVSYAGLVAGRGVVVVSHTGRDSGLRTTVEPVTASVTMGEQVAAGDPIGIVSTTPGHCAPAACVHWGLLRGTTYLDPLRVVAAVPVRLLPLAVGSGPGVSLLVGPPEPFDRHVGIHLGRRQ